MFDIKKTCNICMNNGTIIKGRIGYYCEFQSSIEAERFIAIGQIIARDIWFVSNLINNSNIVILDVPIPKNGNELNGVLLIIKKLNEIIIEKKFET